MKRQNLLTDSSHPNGRVCPQDRLVKVYWKITGAVLSVIWNATSPYCAGDGPASDVKAPSKKVAIGADPVIRC